MLSRRLRGARAARQIQSEDRTVGSAPLPYGHILVAALCQLFALWWSLQYYRYLLNPDGVAYLRIAQYVQQGASELMISGYWGPLLSWLMVPLLALGVEALMAARLALMVSAFVFLGGAVAVFAVMRLPRRHCITATWLTVYATISWTFREIAPDLLLSGLLCLATATALSPRWTQRCSGPLLSGTLFGIAYLTKAVAFPLAFMLTGLSAVVQWRIYQRPQAATGRACLVALLWFALVATPWVVVLSVHYGHPTFSTSGKINHALAGPRDVDRFHPVYRVYHIPEPGRLTQWEEPSVMAYHYWSPLERVDYFVYQGVRILKNSVLISLNLLRYDLLGLGFLSLFIVFLAPWPSAATLAAAPWRMAILPSATIAAIYLPVYGNDLRYYYAIYPFILAAALSLPQTLAPFDRWLSSHGFRRGLAVVVPLSFLLGFPLNSLTSGGGPFQRQTEYEVAQYIREHHQAGPVGDVNGRNGLYLAYFLQQPWYGSEPNPEPDDIVQAGIRWLCMPLEAPVAKRLQRDHRFQQVDTHIFPNSQNPYFIFAVLPPSTIEDNRAVDGTSHQHPAQFFHSKAGLDHGVGHPK